MTISHKMMSYDECGKVVHRERERERERIPYLYTATSKQVLRCGG